MVILGITALASVLPLTSATSAAADETNENAHNGHRVALISTGQVDDPMEDVLENLNVLGTTYITG
ncbi:hypothetical protein ACFVIM_28370 [Streptomyces sp. NPDC057638]|uniref:hypothetical protein n=1 Tax=Streptomyces sp. NPDC057638 TaxID=3346190 RepID=UPI0036832597